MSQHAGILIALRQTFVRLLFACFLLACGATPSLAQGGSDANTLLLLRFENSLAGEQGETPTQNFGVTFEGGISGQGALVDSFDVLNYTTADNFNMPAGTIEFWIKPRWGRFDVLQRDFFSVGTPQTAGSSSLALFKAPNASFHFLIGSEDSEAGQMNPTLSWNNNEWHHVAVTWTVPGRMITYIDGFERLNHASGSQDLLSPVPPSLILGSGGSSHTQVNSVIDELRVSNVARTPEEIAARYFSQVTVNSISLNVVTRNLWKTWRILPTVTADTSRGTYNVPSSVLSWSSSNTGVATVNAAGQVVGVGAGSAVLTATLRGAQTTLAVNVRAPAIEPRVEAAGNYLATPAAGALYEIPVVILRYLPTADGVHLDVAWSPDFYWLNPITLSQLERNLDRYDQVLKFMLEEGSRFRGYGSQAAPPSLGYRVAAVITVYEPTPPGKFKIGPQGKLLYDAEWFQVFERFGLRNYIEGQGVKEVWFWWGGVQPNIPSYDPALHPPENLREGWESNMSSPTTGDVSNSNRDNTDLPVYDRTYIVHGRNLRRLDPTTIHGDGHQLESMLEHVNLRQDGNRQLLWQKFAGLNSSYTWQRGRCGDAHHPPNADDHYDYDNFTSFDSDIMDWRPDGGGQFRPFSAQTLLDTPYKFPNDFLGGQPFEALWHIFWRQSMPGRANNIPFGANRMTNWWQFVGDWDGANRAGLGLYEPGGCDFALSAEGQNFTAGGGAGVLEVTAGAGCRWMATSNAPWVRITSGDTSNADNRKVNFTIAPNNGPLRSATLVVAGRQFTVTQAPGLGPVLMTEEASQRAIALDSVTFLRDPFSVVTNFNFSQDRRSRIMLFAANADLMPGENTSVLTAQAEDSLHGVFPLAVEFVGKAQGVAGLTQINVKLPDELANAGDVWVSITLRGVTSNKAMLTVGPSQ